jgi:hypothetical protein
MLPLNEPCIDGSGENHRSHQQRKDDSYEEWPYWHMVDIFVVTVLTSFAEKVFSARIIINFKKKQTGYF